jgi:hypothetical protein
MKKYILILLLAVFPVSGIFSAELIPRRIYIEQGSEIPDMAGELLFSCLTAFQPLVAVDKDSPHHNTARIIRNNENVLFQLYEKEVLLDEEEYSGDAALSYEDLYRFCRETSDKWSAFLAMVLPDVKTELVDERETLAEEVALDMKLARDHEFTLWLPPALIFNMYKITGAMKLLVSVQADYSWFFRENFGVTASFGYEYDPENPYSTNFSDYPVHRFIPGIGMVFRTPGKISLDFIVKLGMLISFTDAGNHNVWETSLMLGLFPDLSWNINEAWSLKFGILGIYVNFKALGGTGYDIRNQIDLLKIGGAYRW